MKVKKIKSPILYLKFSYNLLSFFHLFFLSFALCVLLPVRVLNATLPSSSVWQSFSKAGKFITAIAWDKDNHLWVAGEEFGVSMIPARQRISGGDKQTIQTFDIPYCYTIVCDNLGRVWLGSLRQGLFRYEKGQWSNFNTSNGLPSNSIHALAVDKDNNLYCAAGLHLAKFSEGKWEILSLPSITTPTAGKPDNLPNSEISCMDFDEEGNLWVGFFLGEIAKFDGQDWEIYHVSKESPPNLFDGTYQQKDNPGLILNLTTKIICQGVYTELNGLVDERVNDILASKDGTIWVATCKGVSNFNPKTGVWRSFTYTCDTLWLSSPVNYVLDFTQDESGNIFFANRHEAIQKWDNKEFCAMGSAPIKNQLPDNFVYCITTDEDDYIWAGTYGGGITTNNPSFQFPQNLTDKSSDATKEVIQHPITLKETPTVDFLKDPYQKKLITKFYNLLKNAPKDLPRQSSVAGLPSGVSVGGEKAYYIGEDWLSRGDWLGRYGEYAYILCAYHHTHSLLGGSDKEGIRTFKHIEWNAYIGENRTPDDVLRGWVERGLVDTDNPKVLQDPLGGGRRYTEWDDHGEAYPKNLIHKGPHIYLDLDIPEGAFIVSFYFMDKASHERPWERFRDYDILVKKRTSSLRRQSYGASATEKEFEETPVLASCRVHDFRAGVYKRFMLKGPGKYTIKFDKKESFNINFSAVFIDKVE